jgi:hypothetical protein
MFRWERDGQIRGLSFVVGEQSAFDASALARRPDRDEWMPQIQRLMELAHRKSAAQAAQFKEFLQANGINPPGAPPRPPPMPVPVLPSPPAQIIPNDDPILTALLDPDPWGIDLDQPSEADGDLRNEFGLSWSD